MQWSTWLKPLSADFALAFFTLDSPLLVMGACGHSRIIELRLAGTTRQVLASADLPGLFST